MDENILGLKAILDQFAQQGETIERLQSLVQQLSKDKI